MCKTPLLVISLLLYLKKRQMLLQNQAFLENEAVHQGNCKLEFWNSLYYIPVFGDIINNRYFGLDSLIAC
jgi:hypothetical protein